MAVFTNITLDDAQGFCARYPDIDAISSIQPIAEGTDNSNFILETDTRKYILTIFEGRIPATDLPAMFDFAQQLSSVVPTPIVYRDKNGEQLNVLKDKPAALISFLSGKSCNTPEESHCHQLGQMLGKMHSVKIASDLHPNPLSVQKWHELYRDNVVVIQKHGAGKLIERLMARIDAEWPKDEIPYGPIHADIFPDNVFFESGHISGLIDFYFSCRDFYIYDLMLALNAWCFDAKGSAQGPLIRTFLQAYTDERRLNNAEHEYLSLMGQAAALRIALTRFRDLEKPGHFTPRDPMAYVNIIKFYQQNEIRDYLS